MISGHEPLSASVLLQQKVCCGRGCKNCPYIPRNMAGSTQVAPAYQRWLWFDFDGTLADSFQLQWEIFQKLTKKYGRNSLDDARREEYRKLSAQEFMKEVGVPWWRVMSLLQEGRAQYQQRVAEVNVFPGWADVLPQLRESYQLGIVTSNSFEIAQAVLKQANIDHHFSFIQSDLNLWGKAKTFTKTLRRHQLFPIQVQYVGDEVRDVESARAVGMQCWAVSWGFNSADRLAQTHPHGLLKQPHDLLATLDKW